ncbi:MAG: type IV pilin protein [Cycloclasticus sp.]|nr:type IV pilin protein [Cycloclasticus sp.]
MKSNNTGFTLIELMIVVAIIGILAAVAYPSYTSSVQAAKRATAQADLMELASFMERNFTENNTYAGATIAASGITNDDYTLTAPIPGLGATTYTLTAVPNNPGSQANDMCGTMTLTQTGATTAATNNCWR